MTVPCRPTRGGTWMSTRTEGSHLGMADRGMAPGDRRLDRTTTRLSYIFTVMIRSMPRRARPGIPVNPNSTCAFSPERTRRPGSVRYHEVRWRIRNPHRLKDHYRPDCDDHERAGGENRSCPRRLSSLRHPMARRDACNWGLSELRYQVFVPERVPDLSTDLRDNAHRGGPT